MSNLVPGSEPEEFGGGVAAGDYDGDGLVDLIRFTDVSLVSGISEEIIARDPVGSSLAVQLREISIGSNYTSQNPTFRSSGWTMRP